MVVDRFEILAFDHIGTDTRLGIQTPGDEIEELTEDTPVEALASELQQKLQEE